MSAHFFTAAAFRNSTSFSGLSFSWSPGEDSNRASSRGADKFLSASRQSDALIYPRAARLSDVSTECVADTLGAEREIVNSTNFFLAIFGSLNG